MCAADNGHSDCVRLLLDACANKRAVRNFSLQSLSFRADPGTYRYFISKPFSLATPVIQLSHSPSVFLFSLALFQHSLTHIRCIQFHHHSPFRFMNIGP
jgi:hypothetical protein